MRVVGCDERVFRAQRLRVIGPVDQRADRVSFDVRGAQDDDTRVMNLRRTVVMNQRVEVRRVAHDHDRRLEAANRIRRGLCRTFHDKAVIRLVNARLAFRGSPQAHGVRRLVIVRCRDDHIHAAGGALLLRGQPFLYFGADLLHIIRKQADRIHAAQHQRLARGAQRQAARVQLVMNAGGHTIIAEARHVHRTMLLEVRRDFLARRARTNLRPMNLCRKR